MIDICKLDNLLFNHVINNKERLSFLDRVGGVSQMMPYTTMNNKTLYRPIANKVNIISCNGEEASKELSPNEQYKSTLFFLERSIAFDNKTLGKGNPFWKLNITYEAHLFINYKLLGLENDCRIFFAILLTNFFSHKSNITIDGQEYNLSLQSNSMQSAEYIQAFLKRSYDIPSAKYMFYPFNYFILNINASLLFDKDCITEFPELNPIEC